MEAAAVRKALRQKSSTFDDEIEALIQAALLDLKGSGVTNLDTTDPLIQRAVILYARANFGMGDPADRKEYERSYDKLKLHLSVSKDYNEVV